MNLWKACAAACVAVPLVVGCGGNDQPPADAGGDAPQGPSPSPMFLLAGQSNMVGNVDTTLFEGLLAELAAGAGAGLEQRLVAQLHHWYFDTNGGYASYGYGDAMAAFEATELVRLHAAGLVGAALTQPHPTVMCASNDSALAPLALNCGNPFGPELAMGHALSRTLASPTSLIKVAAGGTTLLVDWRSPRSGGQEGARYTQLRSRIQSLRNDPASVHPDCARAPCRWAAFIWFQGENDSFDLANAQAYERNLKNLIADVRTDAAEPDLPVVIVQVGRWAQSLAHGRTVAAAQQAVVSADARARLVATSDLSGFYHYDPAAQLVIGERVANAVRMLSAPAATP